MKPTPYYAIGDTTLVFLKGGGHFVAEIVQCQYNGVQRAYRYKIKSDAVPSGYSYVWEYELSVLFAMGWPDMIAGFIDEMMVL